MAGFDLRMHRWGAVLPNLRPAGHHLLVRRCDIFAVGVALERTRTRHLYVPVALRHDEGERLERAIG